MREWEELSEGLSQEIKKELAQAYFANKVALEKAWEDFLKELNKELTKKEENLILNTCRFVFMLKDEDLINEFETITRFPLKLCYSPEILESSNLKRKIFSEIKSVPFGLTSKSRFVKLFLKIYENLYKAYQVYINTLRDLEKKYQVLKEETEKFYKRYDVSSILGFFERLEEGTQELTVPEAKDELYKSLSEKLKIKISKPPSELFEIYNPPVEPSKIRYSLSQLAKKAFEHHQNDAKELLKLVSEES